MEPLQDNSGNNFHMQSVRKHWFLIALLTALFTGYKFCEPFASLASLDWLKWSIVSVTMFLMAWPLALGNFQRAFSRPAAPLLACALNLIGIPLLVWPLVGLVGIELGPGMMVAAATPCTLASAAVWTRRAGGDDSVAIVVTIITNSSCFLVMPFWIYVQTGNSIESSLLYGTIYKLLLFVVLPIAVAQLARVESKSAAWATANKPRLSTAALIGILSMVFLGAVNMGLRLDNETSSLTLPPLLFMALLLTLVHCIVFWAGYWIASKIKLPREEQIAVSFSGSQKTLMIGLSVAVNLGMSIIPIVAYHAIQLIVDTVFADWMRAKERGEDRVNPSSKKT
jgi:sodium/bile acid cotransporter 7